MTEEQRQILLESLDCFVARRWREISSAKRFSKDAMTWDKRREIEIARELREDIILGRVQL